MEEKRQFGEIRWVWLVIGFLVFWVKGTITLDPDFGWHLRAGQIFLSEGIVRTDKFSYSMPSFAWVDHEWLIDTAMAKVYPWVGSGGIAAIWAILGVAALAVSLRGVNTDRRVKEALFFLGAGSLVQFVGARPQIVSWLLFAALWRVVVDEAQWKRWRRWLPVFFWVWANLHGGFAVGLGLISLTSLIRLISKRRVNWGDWLVVAVSTVVTLVNPYGLGLWREVWSSLADVKLRSEIIEWQPIINIFDFPMIGLLAISVCLVWLERRFVEVKKAILYLFFGLQAVVSARNYPFFLAVLLPVTGEVVESFRLRVVKIKNAKARLEVAMKWIYLGSLGIFFLWLAATLPSSVSERVQSYPDGAADFLADSQCNGRLFSTYNWGGYLIWKFPGIRLFIDGRMPSWKWNASPGESNNAFDEYVNLVEGKSDTSVFLARYKIECVLWPNVPERQRPKPGWITNLVQRLFGNGTNFYLSDWLGKNGWKKVYGDGVAVIYKK